MPGTLLDGFKQSLFDGNMDWENHDIVGVAMMIYFTNPWTGIEVECDSPNYQRAPIEDRIIVEKPGALSFVGKGLAWNNLQPCTYPIYSVYLHDETTGRNLASYVPRPNQFPLLGFRPNGTDDLIISGAGRINWEWFRLYNQWVPQPHCWIFPRCLIALANGEIAVSGDPLKIRLVSLSSGSSPSPRSAATINDISNVTTFDGANYTDRDLPALEFDLNSMPPSYVGAESNVIWPQLLGGSQPVDGAIVYHEATGIPVVWLPGTGNPVPHGWDFHWDSSVFYAMYHYMID